MSRAVAVFLACALGVAVSAPAAPRDDKKSDDKKAADEKKAKRPALDLRISPRFAFSPAEILFTAELTGGDDSEQYHCPEIEWEWNDGGKSVTEADCDPYEPGMKMERRFTATHLYKNAGSYLVKVTLSKASRTIATQSVRVTIRPGLGDPNE